MEIVKQLTDIDGLEKDTVTFSCTLSKPDRQDGHWLYGGQPITPTERYSFNIDGCEQTLTISNLTLEDQGKYMYSIENVSTEATLFVGELGAEFITPLPDTRVMEKHSVTLECEVSKPDRAATWLKNGETIQPSDRVKPGVEGTKHFLTITTAVLDDEGRYTVKVESAESTGNLMVDGKK